MSGVVRTRVQRGDWGECMQCGWPLDPGDEAYTNADDDYIVCSHTCAKRYETWVRLRAERFEAARVLQRARDAERREAAQR